MTAAIQKNKTLPAVLPEREVEERVRKVDPDRALCARFLPDAVRPDVFGLIAFHDELVRALAPARSAAVAGPMAGFIKLQWWREVLEGTRAPDHELAPLMVSAIRKGTFQQATLLRVLEAREAELSPEPDEAAWRSMMRNGAGALQRAVGEALGLQDEALLVRLEAVGAAYGAGAMVRHWPKLQQSGRYLFPGGEAALQQAGRAFLAEADVKSLPRKGRLAALPAVLAARDLARNSEQAGQPRGIGDRLAVMMAALKAR
ncbi:squalene/phytoene synthase family protein [Acetobacter senegalensis]|uniref:squalene/phytoene synthase family protein n=1 Tax=Acetobacter senegalensis TaxID=446692 RepID=UPI001EDC2C54|nr:squalene/phytoene synthase family protein [Acetobacter senegalensis]MCG4253286.1 squalene/phytoene synthase family protein [Acetobacter senegalensis]